MQIEEDEHRCFCLSHPKWLSIGESPIFMHLKGTRREVTVPLTTSTPSELGPVPSWSDQLMAHDSLSHPGSGNPTVDEDLLGVVSGVTL
jgi:hypothetical protein